MKKLLNKIVDNKSIMIFKLSGYFIMIIMLFGCSPLDRDYNPNTVEQDLETLREIEVPEQDVLLLEGYIKVQKMNNIAIDSNLTYEELLDIAKAEKMHLEVNWYINNLAESIRKTQNEKILDSLNSFFTLSLVDKSYDHDAFREYIGIDLSIENKNSVDMKGLKGVLTFYDLFGDILKKAEIKCDVLLPAGQTTIYYARVDYNPLLDNDLRLFQMEKSQLTTKFVPSEIVFADGKSISAN